MRKQFGNYQIRIQYHGDDGPIKGATCVNKVDREGPNSVNMPHINIAFQKVGASDELFNLHLSSYTGSQGRCVLAYESEFTPNILEHKFCKNICSDQVKRNAEEIGAFVSGVLTSILQYARRHADENGNPSQVLAAAVVAGITAVSIPILVDAIVAAWLIPFVPPPP